MGNISHEASDVPMEKNWASSTIGGVVAAGALVAEFSHINDVLRFSAFAAAQKAWGDPMISASVLGASTLFVEGATAVVAADVLATDRAGQLVQKINTKLENLGASKLIKTNIATEAAVAWVGGSAVLTALKHQQDPERTREQNRRYGLTSATGLGLMLTAEGYALSLGIEHPSPVTVGIGALALGGTIGAYKWAKKRLQKENSQPTNPYFDLVEATTTSPQLEGLSLEEWNTAVNDPRTEMINIASVSESAKSVEVPFAVSLDNARWLNEKFINAKGFDSEQTLYCTLPQAALDKIDKNVVIENLQALKRRGIKNLIIDYPETSEVADVLTLEGEIDNLMTDAGTPSAIYHYQMLIQPDAEKAKSYEGVNNVHTLDKPEIEKRFDQMWDIYESRFQTLVDDHPILGMIPKDELLATFRSDGCVVSAYFDEDDDIKAVGYLVNDISLCPWLNEKHIQSARGEAAWVYLPGIAAAIDSPPLAGVAIMKQLTKETIAKYNEKTLLTFECTNTSKKYIPKLVELSMQSTGMGEIESRHEIKHLYKVVKLR